MTIDNAITWILSLTANDWAIIATWVGTVLSWLSFRGIKALRAAHLAKIRLPELLKDLRKEAKSLSALLIDGPRFPELVGQFHERAVVCSSILKHVASKTVPKQLATEIKSLTKTIQKAKAADWTHDKASAIYQQFRSIETLLSQTIKDMEA